MNSFTPIEMMNVYAYNIKSDVTGKYAATDRIFTMYLITEWNPIFTIPDYLERLNSPEVMRDLIKVKVDLENLFIYNLAYEDYKYTNFLLEKGTKRLIIGDIDADIIDSEKFLVCTYRFDEDYLDIEMLESPECFYSVCYLNLLIFAINIFYRKEGEIYHLGDIISFNEDAFCVLNVVTNYKLIKNRYRINILKYSYIWDFVLCMLILYMYENKLDQINTDFPELSFLYDILFEENDFDFVPPPSLGNEAKDAKENLTAVSLDKLLETLNKWCRTNLPTLDFKKYVDENDAKQMTNTNIGNKLDAQHDPSQILKTPQIGRRMISSSETN
jgi:hypothetical protein